MKVRTVRAVKRYRLEVSFEDGTRGEVDLGHLAGAGVFSAWEAAGAFESVSIGSGGEVTWACGVDLCADALYLRLTGKRVEDLFPAVRIELVKPNTSTAVTNVENAHPALLAETK